DSAGHVPLRHFRCADRQRDAVGRGQHRGERALSTCTPRILTYSERFRAPAPSAWGARDTREHDLVGRATLMRTRRFSRAMIGVVCLSLLGSLLLPGVSS